MSVQASYGADGLLNTALPGDASMGGNNVWTGVNTYAAPAGLVQEAFLVVPGVEADDAVSLEQTATAFSALVFKNAEAAVTGSKIFSGSCNVPAAVGNLGIVSKAEVDQAVIDIGAVQLDGDNEWTATQNFGSLIMPEVTADSFVVDTLTATTINANLSTKNTVVLGQMVLTTGSLSQVQPTGESNSNLIDQEFDQNSASGYSFKTADTPYQMVSSICNPYVLTLTSDASPTIILPVAPTCGQQLNIQSIKITTAITLQFQGRLYYQQKNASPVYWTNSHTFSTNTQLELICWDNTKGAVKWLLIYAN